MSDPRKTKIQTSGTPAPKREDPGEEHHRQRTREMVQRLQAKWKKQASTPSNAPSSNTPSSQTSVPTTSLNSPAGINAILQSNPATPSSINDSKRDPVLEELSGSKSLKLKSKDKGPRLASSRPALTQPRNEDSAKAIRDFQKGVAHWLDCMETLSTLEKKNPNPDEVVIATNSELENLLSKFNLTHGFFTKAHPKLTNETKTREAKDYIDKITQSIEIINRKLAEGHFRRGKKLYEKLTDDTQKSKSELVKTLITVSEEFEKAMHYGHNDAEKWLSSMTQFEAVMDLYKQIKDIEKKLEDSSTLKEEKTLLNNRHTKLMEELTPLLNKLPKEMVDNIVRSSATYESLARLGK